jgi:hypothetical protein
MGVGGGFGGARTKSAAPRAPGLAPGRRPSPLPPFHPRDPAGPVAPLRTRRLIPAPALAAGTAPAPTTQPSASSLPRPPPPPRPLRSPPDRPGSPSAAMALRQSTSRLLLRPLAPLGGAPGAACAGSGRALSTGSANGVPVEVRGRGAAGAAVAPWPAAPRAARPRLAPSASRGTPPRLGAPAHAPRRRPCPRRASHRPSSSGPLRRPHPATNTRCTMSRAASASSSPSRCPVTAGCRSSPPPAAASRSASAPTSSRTTRPSRS